MEKTFVVKGDAQNDWLLVDATGQVLGRVATQIAYYLMGKHKPTFTPGVDMGDFVIVINASNIKATQKRLLTKQYFTVSGFPGGIRQINMRDLLNKYPDRVIRRAVWGMLPHNKTGRQLLKRLKVYGGSKHPHEAQNPKLVA